MLGSAASTHHRLGLLRPQMCGHLPYAGSHSSPHQVVITPFTDEKTEAQGGYGLPHGSPRRQEPKLAFQPGLCGSGAHQEARRVCLGTPEPWLARGLSRSPGGGAQLGVVRVPRGHGTTRPWSPVACAGRGVSATLPLTRGPSVLRRRF